MRSSHKAYLPSSTMLHAQSIGLDTWCLVSRMTLHHHICSSCMRCSYVRGRNACAKATRRLVKCIGCPAFPEYLTHLRPLSLATPSAQASDTPDRCFGHCCDMGAIQPWAAPCAPGDSPGEVYGSRVPMRWLVCPASPCRALHACRPLADMCSAVRWS